jgi:tetratricopeptide (TPR) repeat protein
MRLTIVLLFFVSFSFSQTNDSQIAYQFYQSGEYEKAIDIYKDITKGNNSNSYYYPHFQSLLGIENYKDAKKLVLRMSKKNTHSLIYLVDLYFVESKLEDKKSISKTLKKIEDEIKKKQSQLVSVCNSFIKYSFYQEALNLYLIAEKDIPSNNRDYNIQKAQLYQYMDKDEWMVEEYLSLLEKNPTQKINVINYLQRYLENNGIENEENYILVKNGLLKYSQKEKDTYIFSEILIWLFMQNNDFNLAYLQAKSLDKRLREDGERLYDLAETFLDNSYFDLAIKCYQYIIEKGDDNYYYIDAHVNMLYALGKKEGANLIKIDELYQKIVEEVGVDYTTVLLIYNYAHFKAFSLNDLPSAQIMLEEAMNMSNISKTDLAECKLVYADIMLLSSQIWTALLYYSQVEKDHKESPLGHEAKLRRSKVSYYQGDFEWAQSQLDILKSSTSKLISNDALHLSLLITDNLNLDTSAVPMEMYARADLLYFQNRFEESIVVLDSIIDIYSGHTLMDEIYFRKHEIYYKMNNLDKSIEMLETIVSDYAFDILEDDALFYLAKIYENDKKDVEKAFYYYETLLMQCSGSIYTSESRKKYREIRGN